MPDEQIPSLCNATGCQKPSIGSWPEIREVPAWRHPADRLGYRTYEIVGTAFYCAEHEAAAKSAYCCAIPPPQMPPLKPILSEPKDAMDMVQ